MKLEKALLNCEIKKTGENEYAFIMSDEIIDRDGEIIRVDGWDLKNFKKNSILLWGHRHDIPGIGEVGSAVKEDGKLKAKRVRFASPGIYELADIVHGLVDDNILKAVSVGYIAKEREHPSQDDDDKGSSKKKKPWVITTKAELYELSIVNVGANPNALRAAKSAEEEAAKDFTGDEKQFLQEEKEEDFDIEENPYPNEHACRLRDPGDFDKDTFKRYTRDHEGKEYDIIAGKLKGKTKMTEQAYRYKKKTWKASEAKKHCKSHDGTFEAASEDTISTEESDLLLEMKDTLNNLCEKIDHMETLLQKEQKPGKYEGLLAGTKQVEPPAEKQQLPLHGPATLGKFIHKE